MRVLLAAILTCLIAVPAAGGTSGSIVLGESVRGLTAGLEGATPAEVRKVLGKPLRIVPASGLSETLQIWHYRYYVVQLTDMWSGTDGYEASALVTSNPRDRARDGTRVGTTRQELTRRYRRGFDCPTATFCRLGKDPVGTRDHQTWFQLRSGRVIRIGIAGPPAGLDVGYKP